MHKDIKNQLNSLNVNYDNDYQKIKDHNVNAHKSFNLNNSLLPEGFNYDPKQRTSGFSKD